MTDNNLENLSEQEYFDKYYNIAYYDETLPKPSNDLIFMHYISSSVIYAFFTMFILFNPFYVNLYAKYPWANVIVIYLFLSYLIIAPILLFTIKPKTIYASHSIELMNYILKIFRRDGYRKDFTTTEFIEWLTPTYKQKQSFFVYFVKLYFGPQFVLYAYFHFRDASIYFNYLYEHFKLIPSVDILSQICTFIKQNGIKLYSFAFFTLYFIDCGTFAIGYCTELCILRNRIRSVETSFLGLLFCLMCYVPISGAFWFIFQWNHVDRTTHFTQNMCINITLSMLALLAMTIYVSASVALFTKGSNLTNRGTVTCFPYNIVRHPAYSTKILGWIIGSVPVVITLVHGTNAVKNIILYVIGACFAVFIYYMRAITEERHLSRDPEYRAYTKKVKYQFIPKVW